jgi:hypothetical protein
MDSVTTMTYNCNHHDSRFHSHLSICCFWQRLFCQRRQHGSSFMACLCSILVASLQHQAHFRTLTFCIFTFAFLSQVSYMFIPLQHFLSISATVHFRTSALLHSCTSALGHFALLHFCTSALSLWRAAHGNSYPLPTMYLFVMGRGGLVSIPAPWHDATLVVPLV